MSVFNRRPQMNEFDRFIRLCGVRIVVVHLAAERAKTLPVTEAAEVVAYSCCCRWISYVLFVCQLLSAAPMRKK